MASVEHIAISALASGDNVLRAAVTGSQIRLLSYTLVCDAAVGMKFKDSGDLSGVMSFAANGGVSAPFNPEGHVETATSSPLVLNLSSAVAVAGHATIQIFP